jgi:transcriptional regulator GlxA family with amidase domain
MDARVESVIKLMHQRLAAPLSIEALSRGVNLTRNRLRQLFQQETGRSPIQYLKGMRMERAEWLLQSTFHSIKEVTFLIGARDVSHFVRDFKKRHGLTPSEYRAQNRPVTSSLGSSDE